MQIVAYDFGIKHNILRRLASFGCKITVVPADYPASKVLDMNPDGVFLSNGPVSVLSPSINLRNDTGLAWHLCLLSMHEHYRHSMCAKSLPLSLPASR